MAMANNSALIKCDLKSAACPANDIGACTLCGKISESKCDRCGDFYCSEICQQIDWKSHRFICFPMPKLVKVVKSFAPENNKISENKTNSPENYTNVASGSCVVLTAFTSTNKCYIRTTNPSTAAEYNKAINDINEFGKNSSGLSEKPKNNSFALTLKNGKWRRVKILGENKGIYRIFFTDSGETCKRNIKEFRKISPEIESIPRFLKLLQLKGVTNNILQGNFLKQVAHYINREYKVEFVKPDKSGGNAELFIWGTTILLNSLIQTLLSSTINKHKRETSIDSSTNHINDVKNRENSYKSPSPSVVLQENGSGGRKTSSTVGGAGTQKSDNCPKQVANKVENNFINELPVAHSLDNTKSITAPRQIPKPCLIPPFEIIPLNENDRNCKIIITDVSYAESGFVGCLLEKYYENLKAVANFLKEYNVVEQPYKPKLNEYCLAIFENAWYRAKVIKILSDNMFLVVYIDFTNELELTSESIRRYPLSLNLPCYTTLCAIDGLPEDISDEIKNFLEVNCSDFPTINIDSVRIQDNIHHIKSNDLLKKMHDSKLL